MAFPRSAIGPVEWVFGFRHDRAAQITALEWTDGPRLDEKQRIAAVDVFVATETPFRPWVSLGTWTLQRGAAGTAAWQLDHAVWARYVLFRVKDRPPAGQVSLPGAIAIRERTPDVVYNVVDQAQIAQLKDALIKRYGPPQKTSDIPGMMTSLAWDKPDSIELMMRQGAAAVMHCKPGDS